MLPCTVHRYALRTYTTPRRNLLDIGISKSARATILFHQLLLLPPRRSIPSIYQNIMSLRTAAAALRRRLSSTTSSNSHSDFSRVVKKDPPAKVSDRISAHLDESNVVLYMKGLPSQPACGFSWRTVQVLNAMGVEYRAHNVLADDDLRQGIKTFGAWPTIPQLYVGGEFVGGCDIVESMARSGELRQVLDKAGAIPLKSETPQSS